jgi:hypothetical protein
MTLSSFALSAHPCRAALCAGMLFTLMATPSLADSRCQQLETLHRQYLGVTLTSDQQQLKRKLVAWYNSNCRSRRASH